MPKVNVCVVGLAKDFTDKVCIELSELLELYYANVEKILEFELFDHENIEKVCGKDYLQKEQNSIIKRLCTYEDTLINLNYYNLNNDEILNNIKENCLLIYLQVSLDKFNDAIDALDENNHIIDKALFIDRDRICKSEADIVIDCKDLAVTDVVKLISDNIISYYS